MCILEAPTTCQSSPFTQPSSTPSLGSLPPFQLFPLHLPFLFPNLPVPVLAMVSLPQLHWSGLAPVVLCSNLTSS